MQGVLVSQVPSQSIVVFLHYLVSLWAVFSRPVALWLLVDNSGVSVAFPGELGAVPLPEHGLMLCFRGCLQSWLRRLRRKY